jgi:hypothetical protein
MLFRKPIMSMSDDPGREYQRFEVREENVRALVTALAAAGPQTTTPLKPL